MPRMLVRNVNGGGYAGAKSQATAGAILGHPVTLLVAHDQTKRLFLEMDRDAFIDMRATVTAMQDGGSPAWVVDYAEIHDRTAAEMFARDTGIFMAGVAFALDKLA